MLPLDSWAKKHGYNHQNYVFSMAEFIGKKNIFHGGHFEIQDGYPNRR